MKLEINDKFTISYYAKKHKSIIFRKGKWTNLSREWVSKGGDKLLLYFYNEKFQSHQDESLH